MRWIRELAASFVRRLARLQVVRELLAKKKRYGDDDTVARDRPWGQAPALFGAQVIGLPASFRIKPPEKP